MKKLFVLTLLAVMAFSAKTFAQSTALVPYDGATQTYTFDGIHQDYSYEFIVSTSATDWNAAPTKTWGVFSTSAPQVVGSDNKASVSITWDANASANFPSGLYLYIHVFDNSGSPDLVCDNYKAVLVKPTGNNFTVTLADATGENPQCPQLDNGFQPVLPLNGLTTDYSSGKTIFKYTVTRNGADNHKWSFKFDIAQTDATNFSYTVEGTNSGTIVSGNQSSTLTGQIATVDSADGSVTITVTMDNVPGSKPVFTVGITNATDVTSNVDVLPTKLPVAVDHNINEMPAIGGFTGN